jgi:phosphonate transport system ATP-binding protein
VEILELLTRLAAAAGVPVIVNIHNVALAQRFAQRIVGMAGGEIVFDGPPEALEPGHLRQIYGGEDWL